MNLKCLWNDLLNYVLIYITWIYIQRSSFAFITSNYQTSVISHFVPGAMLDATIPCQPLGDPNLVIISWDMAEGHGLAIRFEFLDLPFTNCDLKQNSYYFYSGQWWKVTQMCNMEIGGKRLTPTITKMGFKILDKEMELERNFETSRTAEGGTRAGPREKDYFLV